MEKMMTPEEFLNKGTNSPEDLIGKARTVARIFCEKAKSGDDCPLRLLFYGQAGIGKSAACKIIANALSGHPSMVRHVSGAELTSDMVREWMQDFCYVRDEWSVYLIEEIDKVNESVETLLLQFMDKMPKRTAILMTSNEKMSGLESRFTSRTKAIKFESPKTEEVESFLLGRWPELGDVAREIAFNNNGDVRASINDVQLHFDALKYKEKKDE
jgi:replication-associated recombination protein RarA